MRPNTSVMYFCLVLGYFLLAMSSAQEDIIKCLESNTHKPHPSSEDELHGEVRHNKNSLKKKKFFNSIFLRIDSKFFKFSLKELISAIFTGIKYLIMCT